MKGSDRQIHADRPSPELPSGQLAGFLKKIVESSAEPKRTEQFLRACIQGDAEAVSAQAAAQGRQAPFLTIVTRTQGKRQGTLRDMLMCLAGQTCQDFELLIALHKCQEPMAVRALVQAFPRSFADRVRFIECAEGNRVVPLNAALAHARGDHLAFLDDDDLVLGHWVETFSKLSLEAPGMLLRAGCTRQEVRTHTGHPASGVAVAASWFIPFPLTYDPLEHLLHNQTPFMSVCFPAKVFRELGMRFDEALTTTEDWDFTTRAAMICGVHGAPWITAIYRLWTDSETSHTEHGEAEWKRNYQRILDRLDAGPILLPAGSARRIRELVVERKGRYRLLRPLIESDVWWIAKAVRFARRAVRALSLHARRLVAGGIGQSTRDR